MVYARAILLFLYNVFLVHVMVIIGKALQGTTIAATSTELRASLIWGLDFTAMSKNLVNEDHSLIAGMWSRNILINSFLLLPAVMQHRFFSIPLALVLTWNVFIYECMFSLTLSLLSIFWESNLGTLFYMVLVLVAIVLNAVHCILIIETMALQWFMYRNVADDQLDHDTDINTDDDNVNTNAIRNGGIFGNIVERYLLRR